METNTYARTLYNGAPREKHIGPTLHSAQTVLESDEDQPIIMELSVGFDSSQRLTIAADFYDYEDSRFNCSTAVTVNKGDASAMARRHKVRYSQLPRFINECMAEWDEIPLPGVRDVRACMKEIIECLIEEGCRLRVSRTYGRHGYRCD